MTLSDTPGEGLDPKAVLAACMANFHPDAAPSSVEIAKMEKSIRAYLAASPSVGSDTAGPPGCAVTDAMVEAACDAAYKSVNKRAGVIFTSMGKKPVPEDIREWMRAAIEAAIATPPAPARLVGWLIESGRQAWWDGRAVGRDAHFTDDANEAIRFARYEDAELARCWLFAAPHLLRSTEHMFVGD